MKNFEISKEDSNTRMLLEVNKDGEACPICGTLVKDMCFSWNIFHGEASGCECGIPYQIKSYHIDKPSPKQQEFLDMLDHGYIWAKINTDWLDAAKQAWQELKKPLEDKECQERMKELKEAA